MDQRQFRGTASWVEPTGIDNRHFGPVPLSLYATVLASSVYTHVENGKNAAAVGRAYCGTHKGGSGLWVENEADSRCGIIFFFNHGTSKDVSRSCVSQSLTNKTRFLQRTDVF